MRAQCQPGNIPPRDWSVVPLLHCQQTSLAGRTFIQGDGGKAATRGTDGEWRHVERVLKYFNKIKYFLSLKYFYPGGQPTSVCVDVLRPERRRQGGEVGTEV